jgi:SSS family solute:Na+ symporter
MPLLDLAIIGTYLAGTLLLSAWLGRSNASPEDHHVGGRRLPWWALSLSTVATQSSANSFIGIPAFVALVPGGGLTWLQYELAVPLATLVVMIVFVPVFRGLGLVSIYEYLEIRFDRSTRLLLSGVFLASRALATGVALYAAAVVIEVCTGLPPGPSVLLMGAITVVYDMLGGMRAVVWTDVIQMLVLLSGIVLCGLYGWSAAGGWQGVLNHVSPSRLAAIQWGHGVGDGVRAPLWGFVVGGFVLYIAYYGVDQSQVQRQLSASSVPHAQRLLAASALGRFPLTLLYAGLGLLMGAACARNEGLRAAIPVDRLDFLVPRFIELVLPTGARGLLVAAVLAAAMSSVDSALNSLSAVTMRDFIRARGSARRQLTVSRLVTLIWGLLITLIAMQAGGFASNVIEGINRVGALFYGPLVAAFACGILDPRATGPAVRAGVAAGLGFNLLLLTLYGPALFWMWWNVSGVLVAAVTCGLLARLQSAERAAPPSPRDTVTLPTLRARVIAVRGWAVALLAYTAAICAMLAWLGITTAR